MSISRVAEGSLGKAGVVEVFFEQLEHFALVETHKDAVPASFSPTDRGGEACPFQWGAGLMDVGAWVALLLGSVLTLPRQGREGKGWMWGLRPAVLPAPAVGRGAERELERGRVGLGARQVLRPPQQRLRRLHFVTAFVCFVQPRMRHALVENRSESTEIHTLNTIVIARSYILSYLL